MPLSGVPCYEMSRAAPEVVRLVARGVLKLDCRHTDVAHRADQSKGDGSVRHGHVRVLSAVAQIDDLDQTGAGDGVWRVLAPLAVEGIECPPAADPHLRD